MTNLKLPKKLASTSTKTALIDGDIIAYRIGFACEKNYYYYAGKEFEGKRALTKFMKEFSELDEGAPTELTIAEPVENALHSVNLLIDQILEATDSGHYKVYLTGDNNFREKVATTYPYKGTRTGRKPIHYQAIRDFLVNRHGAVVVNGEEADDAMAMAQEEGPETVIASLDKDLMMVPGWHYDWVKDKLTWVDEMTGMKSFYTQLLTGDTVDNIVGLAGIGPKKAEKILDGCETEQELFEAAYCAYCEHLGADADERMAENATLLWMKRHPTSEPFEDVDRFPV